MTIRYKCPECGAALNIDDELAGTEGNCPRCQVAFVVPQPESRPAAEAEPVAKAEAVSQPAAGGERKKGSSAAGSLLSEDDIGDFLSSEPVPSKSGGEIASLDSDDALPVDTANPFDEDGEEAEAARRARKQKQKRGGSAAAKSDSTESASIAKNLMSKGGSSADAPVAEPAGKKKRKQFGAAEEHRPGEMTGYKDVVTYLAKMGWPFLAGGGAFLGLCIWLSFSMMKHFDAPPLARVTGTVTLDGQPVKDAIVKFVPQGAGKNLTLGTSIAMTDASGKFDLVYANDDGKPIMGAVIGMHQVQVQLNDIGGAQKIPLKYSTYDSDLKADVKKGMAPLDFPLKSDPVEKTE